MNHPYPLLTNESSALLEEARRRFQLIKSKLGENALGACEYCLGIDPDPLSYVTDLRKDREITSFEEIEIKKYVTWALGEINKIKANLSEVELEDLHAELQNIFVPE